MPNTIGLCRFCIMEEFLLFFRSIDDLREVFGGREQRFGVESEEDFVVD